MVEGEGEGEEVVMLVLVGDLTRFLSAIFSCPSDASHLWVDQTRLVVSVGSVVRQIRQIRQVRQGTYSR